MEKEKLYTRLTDVFRDVFDDDTIEISGETTADDIEAWDSLEHINLILAVEVEFGLKFSMGEVIGMKDVGDMAAIITERGK